MSRTPKAPQGQPQPLKKKHTLRNILLGACAFIALVAIISQNGGGQKETATTASAASSTTAASAPAASSTTAASAPAASAAGAEKRKATPEDAVPADGEAALAKAESYATMMNMSKQGVYEQLVSSYGEKFSAAAAKYAINHVEADWKANAVAKARDYREQQNMSTAAIKEQLSSKFGEKFTAEEAAYAVAHMG